MINITEVLETNKMIEEENLDVRTITLGISLLDCIDSDLETLRRSPRRPKIWYLLENPLRHSTEFPLLINVFP